MWPLYHSFMLSGQELSALRKVDITGALMIHNRQLHPDKPRKGLRAVHSQAIGGVIPAQTTRPTLADVC